MVIIKFILISSFLENKNNEYIYKQFFHHILLFFISQISNFYSSYALSTTYFAYTISIIITEKHQF